MQAPAESFWKELDILLEAALQSGGRFFAVMGADAATWKASTEYDALVERVRRKFRHSDVPYHTGMGLFDKV